MLLPPGARAEVESRRPLNALLRVRRSPPGCSVSRSLCETSDMDSSQAVFTTPPSIGQRLAPQDVGLFNELVDVLYADLRKLARRERFRIGGGATLCTTALVSEAYLKLQRSAGWQSRQHFLFTAALAMRQVLVNAVVARQAEKRNGGITPLSLDDEMPVADESEQQILLVNDAVERLAALSPRLAQVVECRFFAGYSDTETAEALGITDRTVRRDWVKARAWLYRELGDSAGLSMAEEPSEASSA
jgi:RNA polymerase sigma factor (TIGR02999 family)